MRSTAAFRRSLLYTCMHHLSLTLLSRHVPSVFILYRASRVIHNVYTLLCTVFHSIHKLESYYSRSGVGSQSSGDHEGDGGGCCFVTVTRLSKTSQTLNFAMTCLRFLFDTFFAFSYVLHLLTLKFHLILVPLRMEHVEVNQYFVALPRR